MATVKIKFRPSSVNAKEGILFYQVIHNRVARQINAGCKIYPAEWDNLSSRVVIPPGTEESRCHYLHSLENRIKEDTTRLRYILARLDRTDKDYSADKVVELFFISPEDGGFISFCQNLINQLKQIGKVCTAETYATSLNSFIRFRGDRGDIPLGEVDTDLMAEYEVYLKSNGICPNSSSYYMRNLRAMYNRAVEKELVVQRSPFKYVYTGIDKTVKRAVSAKVIRQIRDLDLVLYPLMDYARDIFMFSFYTRGMSFIDMAYLKKEDLKNGILSYRRQKTKQQLLIKWEQPMQDIIDKYDTSGTPYLLPIIKDTGKDERRQYKSAEHLINSKLKKIGIQLGLEIPLTTYVARHGWANIAKSKNVPISTISEAMGHDSESTTRIYLASLDTSVIDKANSLVIKSL
ncbi:site-specific integrase [Bacteroides uniformis]|jgi:Site-specific recombinase XerD|uniref:Site-specific integrase n=1 Tax=Bacteroides uniformis TaxID=820 RepID=A0AAW6GG83_BACUN|nr:site-specific integrase [Bacteroides uniformis]MDC1856288.1 site-specific integrase [Bacteroides uniformis]MDC1860603.1 site-specific integrase [Bacteroides uniformis]MDC1873379.1 site-specific integrase [Bacteroides uniformis]